MINNTTPRTGCQAKNAHKTNAFSWIPACFRPDDATMARITALTDLLNNLSGVELQQLVTGRIRGFHGDTIARYLPSDAGTPAERRFLAVLFNTSHPHKNAVALAKNEYYCQQASKGGKAYTLRTLQRYLKSRLHGAFFTSFKGKSWNATNRHELTDGAKRFAVMLVEICRLSLPEKLISNLSRWALEMFVGIKSEQPKNVTSLQENVTPSEPVMARVNVENVTHKRLLSEINTCKSKNTAGGLFQQVVEVIKSGLALNRERHQMDRERRELRRKMETIGHQCKTPQRDVNAISQPDDRIPPGFRDAGEPASALAPVA